MFLRWGGVMSVDPVHMDLYWYPAYFVVPALNMDGALYTTSFEKRRK